MNSSRVLLAIIAAMLVTATACQAAPKHEPGGTYISGTSAGDAETLNYLLAADSASFSYVGLTLDSLAGYDNNYKVILYHLAKPIEVSADGLVYTIAIKDNLKWSDGTKVTAEDYVYTLKNLMFSDWLNYTYQGDWQEEVDGKTVFVEPKMVNDTTFTITRKTVNPEFADIALYALLPYPKHLVQKYEGNVKAFTEAPELNNLSFTGNLGAYKYEDWVRNDKFLTSRNPDFYLAQAGDPADKGTPFFQQREIKIFGTTAARMAALEAGDVTAAGIDNDQVAKFKKLSGIDVYTLPTTGYTFLAYNMRGNGWEGLQQKAVRQALSMAIGKDTLVQSVLLGFGEPAFSFIPKISPWFSSEGLKEYGVGALYDKEKAKQMLVQAGYGTKKADGSYAVTGKDGKPLKLTITTNQGNKGREDMAAFIKQELGDIGIQVDLKLVPWPTLLDKYMKNKEAGSAQEANFNNGPKAVSEESWDIMIMSVTSNPVAPSGSEVFFVTEGGLNFYGYYSSAVDQLFARAKSAEALNPTNRKAIYKDLSTIIADDEPVDFLAFEAGNVGISKKVKGVDPGINMGWNGHRWFFE